MMSEGIPLALVAGALAGFVVGYLTAVLLGRLHD